MPELHFKGKEFVYNHHLTVPYRPLIAQPDKSLGDNSENLIIHGDNLHALRCQKACAECKKLVILTIFNELGKGGCHGQAH